MATGGLPCVVETIEDCERQLAANPGDVAALARLTVLLEEQGEIERARTAAEAWVESSPADADAVRRCVDLLLLEGQHERASAVVATSSAAGLPDVRVRKAAASSSDAGTDGDADEGHVPGDVDDADVVRFLDAFQGRENVYARQWWNDTVGGYSPVREPLGFRVARAHLLGAVTVGAYVVRLDNTVRFMAFDLDLTKRALSAARGDLREVRRLRDLAARTGLALKAALDELGTPALLEDSGYKGRHLWVLLSEPEDAAVVRRFGTFFLAVHGPLDHELQVEFFPRQGSVETGVGNLIKLPLGVHQRTGRRSRLLLADGSPDPEPHRTLALHPRVSRTALSEATDILRGIAASRPVRRSSEENAVEAIPAPLPAPPAPRPSWTSADLDTHPEVGRLFGGCGVLQRIRRRVEENRQLTHDEQVVLTHAVAHSSAGVLAVNYLLDSCVGAPPEARLQSPLAGNPISCAKVRKRVPHLAAPSECACVLRTPPGQYPNPRLHILDTTPVAPAQETAWEPVDRARALGVLWARRSALEAEITTLETQIRNHMAATGSAEIDTGDGAIKLVPGPDGATVLVFEPRPTREGAR